MPRDTELSTYVDSETKQQLKHEADEQGITLSTYTAQLIDRGRMAEAEESLTSRTDVEAALERTIETTLAEYQEDLLDAVRKASVYSIADYELTAHTADASGALRQDTFAAGRRRTHTPLSEHEAANEADSTTDDTENDTDAADENQPDDGGPAIGSLQDLRSRE